MSSLPTPRTTTGHLQLTGLEKVFATKKGSFRALDRIDLDIAPGEFITLLGPSGCGKTTTLRIIAGFETPTGGDVVLDGDSIVTVTPEKRPMAMVFQSYALFPHMSVWDNVAYGLKLKKLPAADLKEQVESALTSMGLTQMKDRAPSQMSGGQQQRVALARAMVMRPKVLLFDEPLSNLDAKLRVAMRSEIRRLQKRLGITAVYVTHDQDEAMSMSDRIVVMNEGKVEQAASPAEVYRHPASVFVADFIGRANFLKVAQARPEGEGSARVAVLGAEVTTPAAPGATAGPCVLLVRPESVRLAPTDRAAIGGRVGRILSTVFFGESVEYVVESAEGNITAVEADPEVDKILEPGQMVEIGFGHERSWLLPAGGKEAYQD
ncbi:MAG: ABC transporter ATP-binding protein [Propionibacteriaceae bacterium]|jgi:iron(III) transport system ATP-binding protein|nr:ABC transporter ATP-binding protein [Propionibacteriaceae bacterium]